MKTKKKYLGLGFPEMLDIIPHPNKDDSNYKEPLNAYDLFIQEGKKVGKKPPQIKIDFDNFISCDKLPFYITQYLRNNQNPETIKKEKKELKNTEDYHIWHRGGDIWGKNQKRILSDLEKFLKNGKKQEDIPFYVIDYARKNKIKIRTSKTEKLKKDAGKVLEKLYSTFF